MTTSFAYALLDAIPHAIFVKDEALRFIYVNKAYETMFNAKKEDMFGKTVLDITHLSKEEKEFYHNEDAELLEYETSSNHVFDYVLGTGKTHSCLYFSTGFKKNDGTKNLIGIIIDVTQQYAFIKKLQEAVKKELEEKKELEKQSAIDPLTQVYNRQFLKRTLSERTSRSISDKVPLSCVMVDIDHFKNINDTFGHLTGDEVLKQMGHILKQSLRDEDMVFRYGGEEFLLLLPGIQINTAVKIAERIRKRIAEAIVLPDGKHITASAGCAEFTNSEEDLQLVKRADDALYQAKKTGRNRVCSA